MEHEILYMRKKMAADIYVRGRNFIEHARRRLAVSIPTYLHLQEMKLLVK